MGETEFINVLRSLRTMKKFTLVFVTVAALIAIALRLIEGPMLNFSAMGALAVLCGAIIRPVWLGLMIPLAARAITDGVLEYQTGHGLYGSIAFDYVAYAMIFGIGAVLRPKQMPAILGAGLLAAVTFFVISNFGVWCMPHDGQYLYAHSFSGLVECFRMAIPFARGTFLGDIGFTLLFFGGLNVLYASVGIREPSSQSVIQMTDKT